MRGPTLNEIRRTDREIFCYILSGWQKATARGPFKKAWPPCWRTPTITFGNSWAQVKNLPDQGRDQVLGSKKDTTPAQERPAGNKRSRAAEGKERKEAGSPSPKNPGSPKGRTRSRDNSLQPVQAEG